MLASEINNLSGIVETYYFTLLYCVVKKIEQTYIVQVFFRRSYSSTPYSFLTHVFSIVINLQDLSS